MGPVMRGIVDLDETLLREIMTPRTAIVALDAQTAVEDARRTLLEAAHSRLPVYSGSIDNVIGIDAGPTLPRKGNVSGTLSTSIPRRSHNRFVCTCEIWWKM